MSTLNKIKHIIMDSNPDQDILYKKWNIEHRDQFFTELYWSWHPQTEKYFFEGNPSFSYEYRNLFDMGRYPIVMLRDGFVGCLDFFFIHPSPPKDFKSLLLIPKKYEAIVPSSWKGQVGCYEIKQRQARYDEKSHIFLFGYPTEALFLRQSPRELAESIGDLLQDFQEYSFFLPIRESKMSKEKVKLKAHYIEFLKELYRRIGFDVRLEFNNYQKMTRELQGRPFKFLNLDREKFVIYDNYIDHHLFSIGGECLVTPTLKEQEELSYQLSNNHYVSISEVDYSKNAFGQFFLHFKVNGMKLRSLYDIFKSDKIRELYFETFLN